MRALIFLIILIVSVSCKKYDLERSIFIADEVDPQLPQYSEWGYNTFGAYYDRSAFVSNNYEAPLKIIAKNGNTSFNFKGTKSGDYSFLIMKLEFIGKNLDYDDMIVLNDSTVALSDPLVKVFFSGDSYENEAIIMSGKIHFKRVQNLLVDKKQTEFILSGYFEFQCTVNGEPISVTNGRFDLSVRRDNFFRL